MSHNREELERIVREHGPSMLRTAVLLTGSRAEAEDLVQDALEACFRRWPTEVEYPSAYLRTAMVRLVQRRRPRLHRLLTLDDDHAALGDDVAQANDRHDLLAALRQLPPRQRAAVVLRHWEGYSEAETADALHCSTGNVKSQTSRGLQKLREVLNTATSPLATSRPTTPETPSTSGSSSAPGPTARADDPAPFEACVSTPPVAASPHAVTSWNGATR